MKSCATEANKIKDVLKRRKVYKKNTKKKRKVAFYIQNSKGEIYFKKSQLPSIIELHLFYYICIVYMQNVKDF